MSKMIKNETEETPIEETEMSKIILGKEEEKKGEIKSNANWLADNVIWEVSKKGCGTSVFDGSMTAAVMTDDDKIKARNGIKRIESEKGFLFVRQG